VARLTESKYERVYRYRDRKKAIRQIAELTDFLSKSNRKDCERVFNSKGWGDLVAQVNKRLGSPEEEFARLLKEQPRWKFSTNYYRLCWVHVLKAIENLDPEKDKGVIAIRIGQVSLGGECEDWSGHHKTKGVVWWVNFVG